MIPYDKRSGKIWYNGDLVDWSDVKVHVLSHGLHYASCVFEGERVYDGSIFKLEEHTSRLFYSAKRMGFEIPYSEDEINLASKKSLYIGNAPDTFLGGGGQQARKIIDNNEVGQILTGNFIFAFPGVQDFHPNPESWFQEGGGPVIDMGPYFFTTLVNLLGPAKNIRGRGAKFFEKREYKAGPKKGKTFELKQDMISFLEKEKVNYDLSYEGKALLSINKRNKIVAVKGLSGGFPKKNIDSIMRVGSWFEGEEIVVGSGLALELGISPQDELNPATIFATRSSLFFPLRVDASENIFLNLGSSG